MFLRGCSVTHIQATIIVLIFFLTSFKHGLCTNSFRFICRVYEYVRNVVSCTKPPLNLKSGNLNFSRLNVIRSHLLSSIAVFIDPPIAIFTKYALKHIFQQQTYPEFSFLDQLNHLPSAALQILTMSTYYFL